MRESFLKNPKKISLCIEKEQLDHIRRQAALMSYREGRPIGVSEVIRRGLAASFPTRKQEMLDL